MSGLTGNFAGLDRLAAGLRDLPDMIDDIAIESSVEIEHAIDSQFTLGTDPYGEPWAPLMESTKRRRPWRDDPPLTDTGAMRSSVVVQVRPDAIEVLIADPAGYHQHGTPNMVARPILPDDARGIPPTWEASVHDAAQRVFERRWDHMTGG